MRESLILFTAIVALAIPAVAIAALLMAYKTARRFDDLECRLQGLARELRGLRTKPDRDADVGGETWEGVAVRSQASAESGAQEKRTYSLSFLEEEPEWKKEAAAKEGEEDDRTTGPGPVRKESGQSAGNRSRRRRRRKKRGNG